MKNSIVTEALTKKYGDITAVDGLNLEVKHGELISLLGVNGAGKTTTIKMLTCLTKPTQGDALVGGFSVTGEPEGVKRLIGVSPQETAVAPGLTVRENLELMCGVHGFPKETRNSRIEEAARRLGRLLDNGWTGIDRCARTQEVLLQKRLTKWKI